MRYSIILGAATVVGLASAGPVVTRQARNDCDILNYALTLEHLENTFYREGVSKYKASAFKDAGFVDTFYPQLLEVAADEAAHVKFLSTALAGAGCCVVKEAKYKFPYTDAKSFVTLASVLEGVGVSAYLGAAKDIQNKDYLTAAGSILTVEARHSSYIRSILNQRPFPEPFDTPLSYNPVFSLAAQFITGFASGDTCSAGLPFKASTPLTLQCSPYYYQAGRSSVTFTNAAKLYPNDGKQVYAVFFSGLEKTFIPVRTTNNDYKIGNGSNCPSGYKTNPAKPTGCDPIPEGYTGQVYVVLSKSGTDASWGNLLSSPAVLEVYPKDGQPKHPKDGTLPCP